MRVKESVGLQSNIERDYEQHRSRYIAIQTHSLYSVQFYRTVSIAPLKDQHLIRIVNLYSQRQRLIFIVVGKKVQ